MVDRKNTGCGERKHVCMCPKVWWGSSYIPTIKQCWTLVVKVPYSKNIS